MVASIDYWIDVVTVVTLTIIYSVHSIESHWQCEIPFKEINKYNLQKTKLFNYRYIVVSFSVSHADVGEGGGGVDIISYKLRISTLSEYTYSCDQNQLEWLI